MTVTRHIIPVGGVEPVHAAHARCWCHPVSIADEDYPVAVHHAKDLREVRERNGTARPDEPWVIVNQLER